MASEVKMLKYLPVTFGLAVLLIASTALAEERRAQKQFVNHNDSMMLMQIGDALRGVSTLKIHYEKPSERMSQFAQRGDLFFDGSIQWDTRNVIGNARVYKWGCEALEYQVKGILSEQRNAISTLELEGWAPTFGRGCEFEEFVWNHNSRLTFDPIYASAPLPPRDIGGLRNGMPLGWVYAGYVTCADYECNSLSVEVRADGVNVRTFPDGPVIGSLVNGTPLVVLQRTERWFYVAAGCNLGPTGVWSDTARVPLSRCY
jgi:hypothetical protein